MPVPVLVPEPIVEVKQEGDEEPPIEVSPEAPIPKPKARPLGPQFKKKEKSKPNFEKKEKVEPRIFIVKPECESQGKGIFLTRTWEDIDPHDHVVA